MKYLSNPFVKFFIVVIFVYLIGSIIDIIDLSNAHDAVLGILGSFLFAMPIYYCGSIIKRSILRLFTQVPQEPDDIIKYIILDKDFIIDLSKVIEEEGGIYLFLKKIAPKSNPAFHKDDINESLIFQSGFNGKYWKENVSSNEAPKIIEKIISAPSVVSYLQKHKLNGWGNYLGSHIFLFITDPLFQKKYAEMLSRAGLDENLARREMTLNEKKAFWDIEE